MLESNVVTCIYGRQCKAVERGVGEARFIYEVRIQKCQKMKLLWRVSKFHCRKSENLIYITRFLQLVFSVYSHKYTRLYFISDLEPDLAKSS
jgi:hypothetical protein